MGQVWNAVKGMVTRALLKKKKVGGFHITELGIVTVPSHREMWSILLSLSRQGGHVPAVVIQEGDQYQVFSYRSDRLTLFSDWRTIQRSIHALSVGSYGLVCAYLQLSDKLIPGVWYTSIGLPKKNARLPSITSSQIGEYAVGAMDRDNVYGESYQMLFFVKVKRGKR